MNKDIWICLETLDWMDTCRLGEYLSSICYLRSPKFLLWEDIIKTHRGSDKCSLKKEDVLSAYEMMNTQELDTSDLEEFYNDNFALQPIPLTYFNFFQTVIWKKIFNEMVEVRKELGVESNYIVIYDIPKFPQSGEEQFNLQDFFEYLDSWLLFQCLGKVSIASMGGKEYYSLEIKLE